jgi:hypothetical protein
MVDAVIFGTFFLTSGAFRALFVDVLSAWRHVAHDCGAGKEEFPESFLVPLDFCSVLVPLVGQALF